MAEERIYRMASLYFSGAATEEEIIELSEWIHHTDDDALITEVLGRAWQEYQPDASILELAGEKLNLIPENILRETLAEPLTDPGEKTFPSTGKIAGFPVWKRIAAVFIVAALGMVAWFLLSEKNQEEEGTLMAETHDLPPGGNRATLRLADGSIITLDSLANGDLAQQGSVKIVKEGNSVSYVFEENSIPGTPSELWNTISTPRGGEYNIVLPDGSRAWLNAESSITFPASFSTSERKVDITGEVYFEVATREKAGRKIPFTVNIASSPFGKNWKGAQVNVLGTRFNIKAYENESQVSTTLLEGSVMVAAGSADGGAPAYVSPLKPGQQANIPGNQRIHLEKNADLEEVMAWKNGLFYFDNADLETVMRQISRWYDMEVVYKGEIPNERFEGTIPRSSNVSEVFRILQLSNIHVKLEGRTATVLP